MTLCATGLSGVITYRMSCGHSLEIFFVARKGAFHCHLSSAGQVMAVESIQVFSFENIIEFRYYLSFFATQPAWLKWLKCNDYCVQFLVIPIFLMMVKII